MLCRKYSRRNASRPILDTARYESRFWAFQLQILSKSRRVACSFWLLAKSKKSIQHHILAYLAPHDDQLHKSPTSGPSSHTYHGFVCDRQLLRRIANLIVVDNSLRKTNRMPAEDNSCCAQGRAQQSRMSFFRHRFPDFRGCLIRSRGA